MASPVYKRYLREFLPAMAGYVLIMFLLWPRIPDVHQPWLKALMALTPVLPMVLVVRAMVRLGLGSDELEQRIQLIALAISTIVVGVASMAGGFLAAAHVLTLDGSVLIWVLPLLIGVYGFARGWASRRYGGDLLSCGGSADAALGIKWILGFAAALALMAALLHGRIGGGAFYGLLGACAGFVVAALLISLKLWQVRRRDQSEQR